MTCQDLKTNQLPTKMENLFIKLDRKNKIFLLIFLLFFSCNKNNSEFENGLIEFEKYFSKSELDTFRKNHVDTAFLTIKKGKNKSYESFFRDNPIGKKISSFFKKNRIDDFDFMSDILLICLHNKYNNKPYNLEELIEKKKWEYNDSYYCEKKRKEKAKFLYNILNKNDTLYLIQPIKEGHIYDITCPITFLNKEDEELIKLSGSVIDKKVILDSLYFTCRIRLTNSTKRKFYTLEGDKSKTIGDTITVYLNDAFLDYSKHRNFMFSY